MEEEKITISLKEYKELLEIKGKYEEHRCKVVEYIPINPNPPLNPYQQTIIWY